MRLQVNLMEARNLAVWGFPWQSNPYCRLSLGSQVMRSRKDDATSHRGSHKAPVWNQEFHFLVTDTTTQVCQLAVCGCCLPDKTAQHLHDATCGSVENLTNIAVLHTRLVFVLCSSCHCCNMLPEADNSVKLVVFLSEGFAIHARNHIFCHLILAPCCIACKQHRSGCTEPCASPSHVHVHSQAISILKEQDTA